MLLKFLKCNPYTSKITLHNGANSLFFSDQLLVKNSAPLPLMLPTVQLPL